MNTLPHWYIVDVQHPARRQRYGTFDQTLSHTILLHHSLDRARADSLSQVCVCALVI